MVFSFPSVSQSDLKEPFQNLSFAGLVSSRGDSFVRYVKVGLTGILYPGWPPHSPSKE